MNKVAVCAVLLLSSSLSASMHISMTFAVGDEKVTNSYEVAENAHFSYKVVHSLSDVLKGQLRCLERFNGKLTKHTLSASRSLREVADKLKQIAMFSSDGVEATGTIIENGDHAGVTLAKIKRGGKVISKAQEKRAEWAEPVRFYLSDVMYMEIKVEQKDTLTQVKRSGLQLDDSEFEQEQEAHEHAAWPRINKILSIDDENTPILCSQCSRTIPSTESVVIRILGD